MALLKEDGSLDIERIKKLPFEEFMHEIGTLTKEQRAEYRAALPINESKTPVHAVPVGYTMQDELARGAVIAKDYIENKKKRLRELNDEGRIE